MKITVIGAGNSGLAMAAHIADSGHSVTLWNRSRKTVEDLLVSKTIEVKGIVSKTVHLDNVTTNINEAIAGTELILITTPASAHASLASILANSMKESVPIVLNPGRTFGALHFYKVFTEINSKIKPLIAETQTIIYTCRKTGSSQITIYSLKNEVALAALWPKETGKLITMLPSCIRAHLKAADSFLQTSLGNVGMVLHCAPFMLNAGWTECEKADYKYYYEGITPTISKYIQHIDEERIQVGDALGVHLESTREWLIREYSTYGTSLFECIQNNKAYDEIDAPASLHHRYIFEDVPMGLVPVEKMGKELGIETKYITLTIDLANALLGEDFRAPMSWINIETVRCFL